MGPHIESTDRVTLAATAKVLNQIAEILEKMPIREAQRIIRTLAVLYEDREKE